MARAAISIALLLSFVFLALGQDCPSSATTCYTSPQGAEPQTKFCCPTPATACSGATAPQCVTTGTSDVAAGAAFLPGTPPITDADILNFALNLEYLEAEFYCWAAFGHGLDSSLTGGGGPVTGGQKAYLSGEEQAYAAQIANDEINHVKFLRGALGSAAVPEPAIDIGAAFATAAEAAAKIAFNVSSLNPPFSPYANAVTFLLGAFIFEDVGVTAYGGAVPLFSSQANAGFAARILGIEAYHAGAIRTELSSYISAQTGYGVSVGQFGNAITQLRAALGGGNESPLVGVDGNTELRAATSDFSLTYVRTVADVISIVTAGQGKGLFFPNGLNGKIA